MRVLLLLATVGLGMGLTYAQDSGSNGKKEEDKKQEEKKVDPRLEKLKSLAGTWTCKSEEGEAEVRYQLTAGGTAVLETEFVGQPHEMVTLYHLDREDLVLAHYCAAGNQPVMRCKGEMKNDTLRFECERVGNIASHAEGHMHAATIQFVGKDNVKASWDWFEGDKVQGTHVMDLHRKAAK